MHWESHGIETGDLSAPFVARITFGTKKNQETLHEWPASSLAIAQQQADDWLHEYVARLGLGADHNRTPAVMRSRWSRLENVASLPDLPDPCQKYHDALQSVVTEISIDDDTGRPTSRTTFGYASRAKIVRVAAAAKASGIDVAGIRVWPDGSIAAYDQRMSSASGVGRLPDEEEEQLSAYDRWAARDDREVWKNSRKDA